MTRCGSDPCGPYPEPVLMPSESVRPLRPASRVITEEVTTWPGVHAHPGNFGALAFSVGRREIGHLHGDHAAHFVLPKTVWRELRGQGRIVPHPVFPDREGPAARPIEHASDTRDVIALLRLNYERIVERHGLPDTAA
jgi:hypothetical protein